jgi:hypothetical protein
MMAAIRNFKGYFRTVILNAAMAPEELDQEYAYREEVTQREAVVEEEGK